MSTCFPCSTGGYVPHQDQYHGITEDCRRGPLLDDDNVTTVMLAVDAMDERNGAPELAPGWHTKGFLDFVGFPKEPVTLRPGERVLPVLDVEALPWTRVDLAAGDALIFGNFLPHRSGPNTDPTRNRRALFPTFVNAARYGKGMRERYYAYEAANRRAAAAEGSSQGKANHFFTGTAV